MKDEDIEKRKLLFIIHENKLDDIVENNRCKMLLI